MLLPGPRRPPAGMSSLCGGAASGPAADLHGVIWTGDCSTRNNNLRWAPSPRSSRTPTSRSSHCCTPPRQILRLAAPPACLARDRASGISRATSHSLLTSWYQASRLGWQQGSVVTPAPGWCRSEKARPTPTVLGTRLASRAPTLRLPSNPQMLLPGLRRPAAGMISLSGVAAARPAADLHGVRPMRNGCL